VPRREDIAARIEDLREKLYLATKDRVFDLEKEVKALRESYVLKAPVNVFFQLKQRVDDLVRAATTGVLHAIEIKNRDFAATCGKMNALSPLAVLERGYSVTFAGERVVKSAEELKKGDIVITRLARGKFTSKVEGEEE